MEVFPSVCNAHEVGKCLPILTPLHCLLMTKVARETNKQTKTKLTNKQTNKKTHQYGFQSLLTNTEKTTFGKVLLKKDIGLLTTFFFGLAIFQCSEIVREGGKTNKQTWFKQRWYFVPKLSAFIWVVCIKNVNNYLLPDTRGPILDLVRLNRFWFELDRPGDLTNRFYNSSWHTPSFPIFLWRLDRPKQFITNKVKMSFPYEDENFGPGCVCCFALLKLISLSLVVWANINILTPGICSSPTPTPTSPVSPKFPLDAQLI